MQSCCLPAPFGTMQDADGGPMSVQPRNVLLSSRTSAAVHGEF